VTPWSWGLCRDTETGIRKTHAGSAVVRYIAYGYSFGDHDAYGACRIGGWLYLTASLGEAGVCRVSVVNRSVEHLESWWCT